MTNFSELNKKSLLDLAEQQGLDVKKSFTKAQIIEILENAQKSEKTHEEEIDMKNEVIVIEALNEDVIEENLNQVAILTIEENPQNEENETIEEDVNMLFEFAEFLKLQGAEYVIDNNVFLINGPKKKICVRIDLDTNFAHVFTVLNKKEFKKENARNILTLKSLKACKSYTISNLK